MRTHEEYLEELDEALSDPDPKERYAAAAAIYRSRLDDLKIIWAAIEQTQRLRQFPNGSTDYAEALEAYRAAKEAHKATWALVQGRTRPTNGALDKDVASEALASLQPKPKPKPVRRKKA